MRTRQLLAGVLALLASPAAVAQPVLRLATDPLLGLRPMHVNVLLNLSLDYGIAQAAYRDEWRNYSPMLRYTGYFNPDLCYEYRSDLQAFVGIGRAAAPAAGDRSCSRAFSGNFMNWAAMSTLDILRMTLTGGRRVRDEPGYTVLERAWLPTASSGGAPALYPGVEDFYARAGRFPRRTVQAGIAGEAVAPVEVASVLPFAQRRATIVNCRDEVLIGNWSGGSADCDLPGEDARFDPEGPPNRYKLRVAVCDELDRANGREGSLCVNFGSTAAPSWKPAGEVQVRAAELRFGAFGYVLDQAPSRYGGVLRHPLDYVGPRRYDRSFRDAGANSVAEWDEAGRLVANPRGAIEGRSGLVNYLNDFGSVPGAEGAYKRHDPAGELFYEAVRYLQWHRDGPTSKATAGMTAPMKGGFPVYTDWSRDPLVCAAQPNVILSLADANTWNDWEIPGNDRCAPADGDCAKDAPRAADSRYGLSVREHTARARAEAEARGLTGLPAPLEDALTGAERTASYYLAGLALYGRSDIRPASARSDDPNAVGEQRFTSFSIDLGDAAATPIGLRQLNVAGVVGAGSLSLSNYMLASSPDRLAEALQSAFSRAASGAVATGSGAMSATTLAAGDAGVFVPYYDASSWSGDVESFRFVLDPVTRAVTLSARSAWRASEHLPASSERRILLGLPGAGARPLSWDALSDAERALFDTDPISGFADGLGERRVAWLRGARDDEGAGRPLRARPSSLIGDVVNAEPAYVAAPAARYALPGYEAFRATHAARARTLFVATNAGMLHALDADTGAERFAFVPRAALRFLPALTHPAYRHRPLLDAPLVAGEAQLGSRWATLLVAGYGAGLQGLFALDITDPVRLEKEQVLWEFTDADDVDMGHVTGRPILAPVRVGGATRWFVIVASGYNNHAPDGAANSDGQGAMFFLDPAKPAAEAWILGRNYWKIRVPLADATSAPGLAQPAAVFDVAGYVTTLYAGDLQGQLWRFDLSAPDPRDWRVFHRAGAAPVPLFEARDGEGRRQPITSAPVIAYAPGGGYLLLLGTGKLIEAGDNTGPYRQQQSFYAVRDIGSRRVARSDLALRRAVRSSEGTLTGEVAGDTLTYGVTPGDRWGWALDLPEVADGEQQINSALLAFGSLLFNTTLPGADPCREGGSGRYCLDPVSGLKAASCTLARSESRSGFLSPPATLMVSSVDTLPDTTGRALRTTSYVLVEFATGRAVDLGTGTTAPVSEGLSAVAPVGRMAWRELINWRELRR